MNVAGTNMKKKKILWVVYDFYQAGGQRYVYEICKALDKEKFEIDFLKAASIGHDKNWQNEYYYRPTLDLGCHVFLLGDIIKEKKLPERGISKMLVKTKRVINKFSSPREQQPSIKKKEQIETFFSGYDHINFSGLNVYKTVCLGYSINPKNSFIHILTARFQDKKNIYEGLDKENSYHFISSFPNETLASELEGFTNYTHTYYPLAFETAPYDIKRKEKSNQPSIIAVFTRLSSMKPLDPYFYALKLLLERGANVELRVYGAGDPEEIGLLRQLNYLYIADKVTFPGHVESIPELLKTAGIDLLWFQSNNQFPAGYAALEIAMSGLPQIFWDFADIGLKNPISEIFPSFTSLTSFVEYSEKLLKSTGLRKKLGLQQREYVQQNNSSRSHIHILEELFH
ncbi:MAG: glycosyltransferase family 4 protein [Ginsengibacter sp.]